MQNPQGLKPHPDSYHLHRAASARLLIGGLMACLFLFASGRDSRAAQALWSEQPATHTTPLALQQLNASLQDLAASVLPAVISLRVQTQVEDAKLPDQHPALPNAPNQLATGSGFILRADGLAITNDHVVENNIHIDVRLYNGETTTAKVLGRDPVGDIALLQIKTDHPLPVVSIGDSNTIKVGEFVVAIGSPFGFEHTITFGVISGTRRRFMRSGLMGGYIQTDASINTGNSGGPLVNMRGEVIGVNTATVGRGELGFSIPSHALKSIIPQLHVQGRVRRGWLGVQIRPLDDDRAKQIGAMTNSGVYVHDVLNDHPAEQAGIVAGDIITQFDGRDIVNPLDLQSAVANTPVGKTVQVRVMRQKAVRTMPLTVGEMPDRQ